MTKEEKLLKVTHDFPLLPEEKQDYILGVLQALAFSHTIANEQDEVVPSNLEQNIDSMRRISQKGVF